MWSDQKIKAELARGSIVIEPYDEKNLQPNSYDLHLADKIGFYADDELDCKKKHTMILEDIPKEGYLLKTGKVYLASTMEYTESHTCVPLIQGKSSLARLGLSIHHAGLGDVGYCGYWTLEFTVAQPLRIHRGQKIGQIYYTELIGNVSTPYNKRGDSKYNNKEPVPIESLMYKNFEKFKCFACGQTIEDTEIGFECDFCKAVSCQKCIDDKSHRSPDFNTFELPPCHGPTR